MTLIRAPIKLLFIIKSITMKKILLVAVLITFVCFGNAQTLKNVRDENPEVSTLPDHASHDRLNAISTKAVRNFKKVFRNIDGERWYTMPDGYRVNFTEKGIHCRCDYDKKGHWLHTIRYSIGEELPMNVRLIVANNYPNYRVSLANEIDAAGNTLFYLIQLEGPTNWVNIKIVDDEVYELQKINKSW
jgi:hypothetical protein